MVYVNSAVLRTETVKKGDEGYPLLLTMVENAPGLLYFSGNIHVLDGTCIAVVGSRNCTGYGRWAGTETGRLLGENGVCVVSGLARGVDSYAHKGALSAGGMTAAVMGCGIDICYPPSNRMLHEEILREGVVISEYGPGVSPSRYTFPERNRIISGVSCATVVAEAGIMSGSLITAEAAAEQGRAVYAIPGDITKVESIGTNRLIRDGAIPLVNLSDILTDQGISTGERTMKRRSGELGKDEMRVVSLLEKNGEMTVPGICRELSGNRDEIRGILAVLELKGVICMEMGKVFVANL